MGNKADKEQKKETDTLVMYGKLINMGFDESISMKAAQKYQKDINKAINFVCQHTENTVNNDDDPCDVECKQVKHHNDENHKYEQNLISYNNDDQKNNINTNDIKHDNVWQANINDIKHSALKLNDFCNDNTEQEGEQKMDDKNLKIFLKKNELSLKLYDILLQQSIGYKQLLSISSYDIDKLYENNNDIDIGTKIDLKNAISSLQFKESQKNNHVIPGLDDEKKEFEVDYKLKVILIGDSAVGKTSIIDRYINDKFRDHLISTAGYCKFTKIQKLTNGKIVQLNIWDTAGEERYNELNEDFYQEADIIIICYGIDSKPTFDNKEKWRKQIEKYAKKDVIIFLVGCKADINFHRRALAKSEGRKLIQQTDWKKYNAWFCECSAKTGDNIHNIFTTAAHLVIKKQEQQIDAYQFQQERQSMKCVCGANLAKITDPTLLLNNSIVICYLCKQKTDDFWQCKKRNMVEHKEEFNVCRNCIKIYEMSINSERYVNRLKDDGLITVVFVGDEGVGKSSLITRYADQTYSEQTMTTLGVDFRKKCEILRDGSNVDICVWDTAGQERFRAITRIYYRDANVVGICYDVGNKQSFNNCKSWRDEIEEYANQDPFIILIGCKNDITNSKISQCLSQNMIARPEWQKYCPCHVVCSAKTGDNIKDIFIYAAETVMKQRRVKQIFSNSNNSKAVDISKANLPKKGTCCK